MSTLSNYYTCDVCRSFPTVPRLVRLVDFTVRRVDSLSPSHARQWHRGVCLDILAKQDGRAAIPSLQFGRCRSFHGCLFRWFVRARSSAPSKLEESLPRVPRLLTFSLPLSLTLSLSPLSLPSLSFFSFFSFSYIIIVCNVSGILAVVDASTLGEFRMYAIRWQMSAGCQLAGFLGVLSSELSVYTLAVITLERNYAITHAMHLNKRLSLKHAGYIMTIGWCFALSMASLPLLGVSDYRKFAICLPFETNGSVALAYVVFLMLINGIAFLILMGCYLKMYCAIRGSQAWNSNDSRIAKRMALLVFTDFLCWSPIAFFSLTATFGLQLVSLEQAKVFAVFVLPLNSCCNPFLYAILTKQFKKDCVLICKAIEESRVTRGIGRCRHSSNFSNRQTPANTNSLVDRSSRENQGLQTPCVCDTRLLDTGNRRCSSYRNGWWSTGIFWPCARDSRPRHARNDQYAYQIAQIQQKQHKRASSVSSSENFSSSRSDSWRQTHHCGIPLRLLDPKRRASSWLITRKPSQDSNLSSSRNDSSGSATTASTSTWRISRSSASLEISARNTPRPVRPKPRLTRQLAVQEPESPGSPGRLAVRLLATIPSAAETSDQQDDENIPV